MSKPKTSVVKVLSFTCSASICEQTCLTKFIKREGIKWIQRMNKLIYIILNKKFTDMHLKLLRKRTSDYEMDSLVVDDTYQMRNR